MSSVDLPRCQLEERRNHPLLATLAAWASHVGPFWAASVAGHLAVLVVAALVLGTVHVARTLIDREPIEVKVDTVLPDDAPPVDMKIEERVLDQPPLDVPVPVLDNLPEAAEKPPEITPTLPAEPPGSSSAEPFGQPGGAENSNLLALTGSIPGVPGNDGVGPTGDGLLPPGNPTLDLRGDRWSKGPKDGGPTRASKGAVIAALDWFKRHQAPDGGWSLDQYSQQCKDHTCTGAGKIQADTAATAFAVLPYLAAGFTHHLKSPYQKAIYGGLFQLVKRQDANDGCLGRGSTAFMYSHGLATICLCEAFGMTKDKQIGAAAQAAIKFIEGAQNKDDGGWRYTPGQPGDTSVTGWQLMALKSAQMAGLHVKGDVIDLGKKYLKAASAKSKQGGLFGYLPESGPSPTMTAVGLLCLQHFGAKRDDPSLAEGHDYLTHLLPDIKRRNSYYWYYATQAMFNSPGADWDQWNHAMRRTLIQSQVKEGCAAGSWDPQKPAIDSGSESGGRIMTTSLAALTLEVYYRYLPLYTLDKKDQAHRPADK